MPDAPGTHTHIPLERSGVGHGPPPELTEFVYVWNSNSKQQHSELRVWRRRWCWWWRPLLIEEEEEGRSSFCRERERERERGCVCVEAAESKDWALNWDALRQSVGRLE
ncbi:hypothetical protein Mp_8g10100 [Marchantia polymorpha subsp. ruderalis]|uniref:Uncharacterized protein n=1 Tax=Marchantia polymorpha TaxID=3197 RepID=A0A2R6XMY7_MARPO|nr:hypothetical protein MARPO_0008s0212 [Marchantia polymorpha]BBN19371.1 hypothetical protein Mp_8g10100 [Marchantia polymorpha subsp. ruderalis]|eukprot:PTQ47462.1 hypothetical protein MARPO_0008s0212 [Marchantia polymorpha]